MFHTDRQQAARHQTVEAPPYCKKQGNEEGWNSQTYKTIYFQTLNSVCEVCGCNIPNIINTGPTYTVSFVNSIVF